MAGATGVAPTSPTRERPARGIHIFEKTWTVWLDLGVLDLLRIVRMSLGWARKDRALADPFSV